MLMLLADGGVQVACQAHIAIVIPTHNRRDHVLEAVASVLTQRHPVELVVVDDGCIDGTFEQLSAIRDDRLVLARHNKPRERSAARNTGLTSTSAEWVMFLDDDDLLQPGALRCLEAAARRATEDVVAVAGRVAFFGKGVRGYQERWISRAWTGEVIADCVFEPFLGVGRSVHRRSNLEAIGGWTEGLPPFEDVLMSLQVAVRGPAMLIPDLVMAKRHHPDRPSPFIDGPRVLPGIRERVEAQVDERAASRMRRRQRAIELLFAEHARGRNDRWRRLRAAAAITRIDPSIWSTPLSRRTMGLMVLKLAGSAVKK